MIVSAEIPEEIMKLVDVRVAELRLAKAMSSLPSVPTTVTRSSFVKEAVVHFLKCSNGKK